MDISSSALFSFNKQSTDYLQTINRLATGKKINKASDDPSGYVRSKMLEKEARALKTNIRTNEREILSAETVSARYDKGTEIVGRINDLYNSVTDLSTDAEKHAVQDEVNQLTGVLDSLLVKNDGLDPAGGELLSSEALGLDGISTDNLDAAKTASETAYSDLLLQNGRTGSEIRAQQVRQKINEAEYINTVASKSTIEDMDMIEGAINANSAAIRMTAATKMLQSAQTRQKSYFNQLF